MHSLLAFCLPLTSFCLPSLLAARNFEEVKLIMFDTALVLCTNAHRLPCVYEYMEPGTISLVPMLQSVHSQGSFFSGSRCLQAAAQFWS